MELFVVICGCLWLFMVVVVVIWLPQQSSISWMKQRCPKSASALDRGDTGVSAWISMDW